AAAGGARGAGAGAPAPADVRIDWNNLARRARQITVPGDSVSGLVASPDGRSVAFNLSSAGGAGGRGGAAAAGTAGIYLVNIDTGALTRVPPAAPEAGA